MSSIQQEILDLNSKKNFEGIEFTGLDKMTDREIQKIDNTL